MLSHTGAYMRELQMRFKVINEDFNQILQSFEEEKKKNLLTNHINVLVCVVRRVPLARRFWEFLLNTSPCLPVHTFRI